MGFSEKMRESLGAEGARLELEGLTGALPVGSTSTVRLIVVGGTRTVHVHGVVTRVIEADRHWVTDDGARMAEEHVCSLPERRGLTAGWDRRTLGTRRIEVDRTVEPGERIELELELELPSDCRPSSVSCSHTLNVQADIRGQIDPTANKRLTLVAGPAVTASSSEDSARASGVIEAS
jgi:sporulation-control protein spo0M